MDHLGLDLGTTTISAAVLDADGGLLCTRTVPGGAAVAGQPWERKQDARGIEHAALSLLDGLLQEFPDIGCVGLTGQMHGIVYVDAAGQLLSPLYTWQDDVPQFRTTFAGTRQDPAERAVLSGLDEENFAPVPLLHALLRGMADELSACYRAALKAGCAPAGRLLGSGNGLRRNPALQRAVERSFGLPLTLAAVPEEAACGAALFTCMQHEAAL